MIFGIDIASAGVKKEVSWARAKADGPISFAFIRSNYGTAPDTTFEREWDRLRTAGLVAGAYMFLRFRTAKHGEAPPVDAQAKTMVNTLASRMEKGKTLPPALDVEFPGKGAVETQLDNKKLLEGIRVAWSILHDAYGVPPIIYTSGRVWRDDLKNIQPPAEMLESPLWLARYPISGKKEAVRDPVRAGQEDPVVPKPWGDKNNWFFHQYQGDAVKMPGFAPKDLVDMNRFNAVAKGDKGGNVAWIQRRVGAPQTKTFDDATVAKVRDFQKTKGLTVDGVVGPKTFTALCWA